MRKITLLFTLLSLTLPSYALDQVVRSGETETNTITVSNAGDRAIIEEGGTLAPSAGIGIDMNDNNQTALNQGTISTTDDNAYGIENIGTDSVITNSGLISTIGDSANGIRSTGARAVITNSGRIATEETEGMGIANTGNDSVITNSGQISTAGQDAIGITNLGARAAITNSGRISTEDGNGIENIGTDSVITNSGLISASGTGGVGILDNSLNVHVINSGTIRSAQSFALNLQGTNPTLTLLRSSNVQGTVRTTNALNLNVETGLNLALTLDSGSFNTFSISAPFVQVGQTIAVIDPTGLALQADVAADLSDTILDGIYRHRLGCCTPCGCGVWAQGIGSYRRRSHDSNYVGYDNWHEGVLLGYDTPLCGGNIGLFGGVSFGKAEVDEETQKADTISYVGGLTYEKLFCNSFLGLAVAAGYVDWDNDRFVMNNLAPGGVEKARADIDGLFVSREITLAHNFVSLWCHPLMSFTLRYAGLFLGGYHEKGSTANLSVKDREIDLLTTRFEVALPYSYSCGNFCWSIEPYAGVFGRYQVRGYRVEGELLGQSISFDQGGPRNLAALLLGFRGIQSFGRCNLFLNLEASFDTEESTRILGEGGIGWNF